MKRIIVLAVLFVTSFNAWAAPVDCATVTYLSNDCFVESLPIPSVRSSNPDAYYEFRDGRYPYSKYNGTLTPDQILGIVQAFSVFTLPANIKNVYSFNAEPGKPTLSSPVSSSKSRVGFYHKPLINPDLCTINFGDFMSGRNGYYSCLVTGDQFVYGEPPTSPTYKMVYGQATTAALLAKNPNATIENLNKFIEQLFTCMRDLSVYDEGGCSVASLVGRFRMDAKTGNWTFKTEKNCYLVDGANDC
jgi:hypothetical protein